jgi:hypothetical protein
LRGAPKADAPKHSIAFVGIDIGKNSFHVVGLDEQGAIVLQQKWSRRRARYRGRASHECESWYQRERVPRLRARFAKPRSTAFVRFRHKATA